MFNRGNHKSKYLEYNRQREKSQCDSLCHAPFQNLLFVQSGNMMVCHYNRAFSLGNFPEVSVSEAWNGPRIAELRKSVGKYEIQTGCQYCGDEIAAGNFLSAGCKKYDYLAGPTSAYPQIMEFQTSNRCNLECIMCSGEYSSAIRHNREQGAPYPDPYDEQFFIALREFLPHLKYASFTGGEPFLNEMYYRIWKEIAKVNPGLNITISTNGTILNERVKEVLSSLNVQLTVSIDSIRKQTYEHIRRNASFEEVQDNLRFFIDFMKKNKRLFSVKFVVMQENIREIPEVFSFFHDQEVQLFPKPAWVPFGQTLRFLDPLILEGHIQFLSSFTFEGGSAVRDFNNERYLELINTLKQWRNERLSFSHTALEVLADEELEGKLFEMVKQSVEKDEMISQTEKSVLLETSVHALDALLLTAPLKEDRRALVLKVLLLPAFIVINELYRNNKEKFVIRFRN